MSVEHTQLPPTELQQPCLTYKSGDEYVRVVGERNISKFFALLCNLVLLHVFQLENESSPLVQGPKLSI